VNRSEAATLLAVVQAYDRRTVGDMDVVTWAKALDDITLADATDAVHAWFRDRTDWLLPADVRKAVKRAKSLALNAAPEAVPDADPDDVPAYLAALRAGRAKTAGELASRPVQALTSKAFQ
jgi:hypothetical protein